MLLEHEGDYGLGMDAMVTVCSWNTNAIMVWAWMHWLPYALEHERNYGLGKDAMHWLPYAPGTIGHGCSPNRTHLHTNGIMVWAWM